MLLRRAVVALSRLLGDISSDVTRLALPHVKQQCSCVCVAVTAKVMEQSERVDRSTLA